MPVSKFQHSWVDLIAKEFGIPAEAIWITDLHDERNMVFIWTAKLSKRDFDRIGSVNSAGGHNTLRGKLTRYLKDLNAEGWLTKVKPSEALPHDLYPLAVDISELRSFCSGCGEDLASSEEIQLRKCGECFTTLKLKRK